MNLYNEPYLIDNLAQALVQARLAVSYDQQGQYELAFEAYRRSISLMQSNGNMLPQQYQGLLLQNVRLGGA